MNSRFSFRILSLVLGLWSLVFSGIAAAATQQLWTCGMHPQIIKTEPGNCPICGMKLVPVRANTGERTLKYYQSTMKPGEVSPTPAKDSMGMDMVPVYEGGGDANQIRIDAATVQRMNLKTALVVRGPVRREIRTVGSVAYDEQGLRDITTKYEGWIEKLFVNATWTRIKAGEPLFEIYSPDLYNAELNYLVARRGEGEAGGPLTRAALGRLQLFDVPPEFIADLAKSGEARRTFVFRAPSDGVVIEKMAVVGQMMKPGERVYRLANLSSVWVLAQVYEQDLPFVQPGQPAAIHVTYGTPRTFEGKVELLVPEVQEQTRAATARIVLPNPDAELRPGMYVDVRFEAQLKDAAVLVPAMAVLRSGERNTVFVARDGGTFEPRAVKLGVRAGEDTYEVLSGLEAGERVVTSGQFMLDSESQLREAIQKMIPADEPQRTSALPTAAARMEESHR
jgi:membrane fusion protein, copper/silver efflux system